MKKQIKTDQPEIPLFCVIGDKAALSPMVARSWFKTQEQAQKHAEMLLHGHMKNFNTSPTLLVVQVVAAHSICEPKYEKLSRSEIMKLSEEFRFGDAEEKPQ